MAEENYSIKEFIEEKFSALHEHISRVEIQTTKTNGRVSVLEGDKMKMWGAFTALALCMATIISLSVLVIKAQVRDQTKIAVDQAFDERFSEIKILNK